MPVNRYTGALTETLNETREDLVTEVGKSLKAIHTDEVKPRHRNWAERKPSTSLNSLEL